MKQKLFKIANILLITGLITTIFALNYINKIKLSDYSEMYEQRISDLEQQIPIYKAYNQVSKTCDFQTLPSLNDCKKHQKIQKSCETLQKTACKIYQGQPECLYAVISNAENKAALGQYTEAIKLLKSNEKPSLVYFNNRYYYEPEPYFVNTHLYSAYSAIYFKMHAYKNAEKYTEIAAKWGNREFKAHSWLSNYAYVQLADNYFQIKNYSKALEYYKKAKIKYSFIFFIKSPLFAVQDYLNFDKSYVKKQIEICKKKLI